MVFPPFSSRIVFIDLESKRNVVNGIYYLSPNESFPIRINHCIVEMINDECQVLASNLSDREEILYAGDDIGDYEKFSDFSSYQTNLHLITSEETQEVVGSIDGLGAESVYDPDDYLTTLKFELGEVRVGKQLTGEERETLTHILKEYKDVMAFDGRIGLTDLIEYSIDIDRSQPVHVAPYRVSPQQREDIIKQAETMLEQDIIEPCRSPWSSPIIIIKKAESKGGGWRFVNDFRQINKLTKNWVYQLPLISDYLRSLAGYNLFCTIDCNSGFYQIKVKPEDRDVTAFIVPGYGSFRYKRMPMGMCTSPQHFQALMDIALGNLKFTSALTFIDDILIPGKDFKQLISRLILVFKALRNAGLTAKPAKCIFAATSLRFLGHVIDKFGIHVDIQKIKAIAELPEPTDQKSIRQFLGKCAYYSDFIDNFSIIAAPLYALTQKDIKFEFTDIHREAFEKLKKYLSSPPILAHYNPKLDTELRTDASRVGIGYRLVQLQSDTEKWHTVSNGSRKLNTAEKNYPITELECLAVVVGLKKNRSYLLGLKFKIVTDHKALKSILEKKDPVGRICRWILAIAEFTGAEIVHRPGTQLGDVDMLSRNPVENAPKEELDGLPDEQFLMISDVTQVPSYEDYIYAQENDNRIKSIIDRINNNEFVSDKYIMRNDLLYSYNTDTLVIELPESLINNILFAHHDHAFSGHHGIERTYRRIKERFNFPKMKSIIKNYVESCIDCQTRKRPAGKPYGMMQIPKACRPTEKWFIDFLGSFPKSTKGNKYVLVCVDSFTRYVETAATVDSTAETVSEFLINNIITRHGMFAFLISDRAKSFVGKVIKNLAERTGFAHITTTSFHPQSNISERVNASIAQMLSNYCSSHHRDWDTLLSSITLALNTQYHRSIDTTPYYLLYARHCILPGDIPSVEHDTDKRLNQWKTACELARKQTERVQKSNKTYYDKRRQKMCFKVGDKVMIYSPNRVKGRSTKLLHLWNGPYIVTDVRSPIVYEIQLSPTKRDVLHVSRMKKYHERTSRVPGPASTDRVCVRTDQSGSSVSPMVDRPPGHHYRTRFRLNNMLSLMLFFYLLFVLSTCHCFDRVKQTQWHISEREVISEVIPYNFDIEFKSPCLVFNQQNSSIKLIEWCNLLFNDSFVVPIENRCRGHVLSRQRRVIPLAVYGVVTVATSLGIGSYFALRTSKYEKKMNQFVVQLNALHDRVMKEQISEHHIKNALEIVGVQMNKTQLLAAAQKNELNSDVTLAAYLSYRFAEVKRTIINPNMGDGHSVTQEFLSVLNSSLPCGQACPVDLTTLMSCSLDRSAKRFKMSILTRKPSANLLILEAKSFIIYNRTGRKNCHTMYTGPKYLILDQSNNCLNPLPEVNSNKYVFQTRSNLNCSKETFGKRNWNKTECSIENTFIDIQVIYGQELNFVYCFENNITINERRFICPDYPFSLKAETPFKVGQFEYEPSMTQRISNLKSYLWSSVTSSFLDRVQNSGGHDLDEYYRQISSIDANDVIEFRNNTQTTLISIASCIVFLSLAFIVYLILRLKLMRQRNSNLNRFQNAVAYETARELVRVLNSSQSTPNLSSPMVELA